MGMKGLVSHVIDGFGRCCHVCSSSVNGVEDAHTNKDRGCDITSAARFAKSGQISAGIFMRVSKAIPAYYVPYVSREQQKWAGKVIWQ